ncbi:MAG: cation diffusion facilitator family transporter [Lachnospiraceae bacterium]|jgi:cation diffusion facilitator family transporter|nr:cation diffusion facilitator family transporter [Lachnospiraceae bacterium]MCH4070897.1 cation diffusion facilitator family transporter [Lachnospiraceae bacterium]MCH4107886.1 cation diffusion facilitator family transporter [Lachnospiraceae bacterium]MCI1332290.1 cation diffusion facilitator family transporter [Lachnospiraceae bacterium]MCI1361592.1 cation diffusion facilitator family transporter [Lachnospiraceae bacterium]
MSEPDFKNQKQMRAKAGQKAGITGIVLNCLLFLFKLSAGLLSHSMSIVSDAVNNLTDAGSSLLTMYGFRLSMKPADEEHPLGHGRFEYITGLLISVIILLAGFDLLRSSASDILTGSEPPQTSAVVFAVLAVSIAVKFWMAHFYRSTGDKIGSTAVSAAAVDSLSDCVVTGVVLLSTVLNAAAGINIDAWASLIVSAFILWSGWKELMETSRPLLGSRPSDELVHAILSSAMQDTRILGIHDLVIHDYGPGREFATMDAELPDSMSFRESHQIVNEAERRVEEVTGVETTIHADPVRVGDAKSDETERLIRNLLVIVDPGMTMHDFEMQEKNGKQALAFDVVPSPTNTTPPPQLKKQLTDVIAGRLPGTELTIRIDPFSVR